MPPTRTIKVMALSLGQGMAAVVGMVVAMVMARVLTKEDLAAYRQTLLAYMVVAPFLQLGLQQGIYFFLPTEKDRIRGRVLDGITVLGIMGLLFAVFIALGGNQILARRFSNPQVAQFLLWMIPYAVVTTPSNLIAPVLICRDKVLHASVFAVVRQLSIGVASMVPVLLWQNGRAPLIGNVTASVLLGFVAIILMVRSTPKDATRPSLPAMRELVKFSFPLGLASMLGTISMQLDKMIVSMMCDPDEFAVYVLGAMEVPFVGIITGAITAVMLADMRKAVAAGNPSEALRLFRLTAEKSSCFIFPLMLFLLATSDAFMQTLYTADYARSALPFRLYLLLMPVRVVVFGSLIVALGRSDFILKRSAIGLTLNVILGITFVALIGPWGAVLGTICSIWGFAVPANFWLIRKETGVPMRKVLDFKYLGKVFIQILPLALVVYWMNRHFTDLPAIVHLLYSALIFGVFLLFWWEGRLYDKRALFRKLVRKVRREQA